MSVPVASFFGARLADAQVRLAPIPLAIAPRCGTIRGMAVALERELELFNRELPTLLANPAIRFLQTHFLDAYFTRGLLKTPSELLHFLQ